MEKNKSNGSMKSISRKKHTKVKLAFGKKLKEIRKPKMTTHQLSEITKMSESFLTSMECGERSFTTDTLYAIAKALNCCIKDLIPTNEEIENIEEFVSKKGDKSSEKRIQNLEMQLQTMFDILKEMNKHDKKD